jgi:putative drug exporter of the RND superfamily
VKETTMHAGNARVRNTTHRPANRISPLGLLGSWCYRHRKLVILAWIGVLVVLSLLGRSAGAQFKDDLNAGNTQSQQAATFLQEHFPAQAGASTQVVFRTQDPIGSPPDRALVNQTLDALRAVPHVSSVSSPFGPGGAHQVSADGHIAYGVVQFDGTLDAIPNSAVNAVIQRAQAADRPGFAAQLAGTPIEKVENPGFGISEGLGLLAAIIILLLAFGSVIAMALPVATAVAAVASMFGALDLLSHVLTVPSFAPQLAALVGLGVGIDYALFVVTRYRHSLHDGATPEAAVKTAMSTSGRAVIFAGSTVVLSLLGLFLLGLPFIYGASLGAVVAVLLVMLASLTLLPAMLGFAGTNIDRLHVGLRRNRAGSGRAAFWWRWSRQVQRRPRVTGGAALLVLVLLAMPFVSMHLAFTDAGTDPTSYTTRQAYDLLAQGFGPGSAGPLVIAAELPAGGDPGVAARLRSDLSTLQDVKFVSPAQYNAAGNAAVITVIPGTSPQDARTSALVKQIRQDVIPEAVRGTGVRALVGGATAASIDTTDVISRHLAVVLAVVILLAVVLLMAAFRSVVIPLASALMTLVSTGAAYGVIVAVFQWGWLGPAIDNHTTAPVDPWIPVMLFALLFGLSMDYQVFLISRIREAWRNGQGDSVAVADGLASTGRVITSAAAIMVCVFGAFVLGDLRILKVFGFAMAVAILLDATLVRMVLMPATLQLCGRANWWFPKRLDRLIPDLMPEGDHEIPQASIGAPT